jgi:translation initiation factor IF-1
LNVGSVSEMYFVMEAFDGEAGVNIAAETDGRAPILTVYKPVPPPTSNPPSNPPSSGGSIGAIKVGSRIMDTNGNVGVVKEIFSNGKTIVELDDYSGTYIREASNLAVRVKCLDYVCPGVRAIDLRGNFGEVKETYSNGKVRMTLDNYSGLYIREARELGIGTKCVQNVCVSGRVIDARTNVGIVKEMFHNGKARVQLDDYSGDYLREASDLGVSVRCLGGICVGNRVMDARNNIGKVVEVFSNGQARVTLDQYSGYYVRQVSTLSKSM